MNRFELNHDVATDEFGFRRERLTLAAEASHSEPERLMANDGLAAADARIDRIHGIGKVSTNDFLLDVGIKPYKTWPTTTEFTNPRYS